MGREEGSGGTNRPSAHAQGLVYCEKQTKTGAQIPLKILVTNDDGVHSRGLWSLVEALKDVGEVSVVAPDRNMSGIGTALTLLAPLRVQEVASPIDGVQALSVQGTPSDCVILATRSLFGDPFDLLVSGINEGANMGLDVLGSGTVGGALRGYFHNIPSIAISAEYSRETEVRYEAAARTAQALARSLSDSSFKGPLLLNVNLPNVEPDRIERVEVTRLGSIAYLASVERVQEERGTHYWVRLNRPALDLSAEGTDIRAVRNGSISITPMDLGLAESLPPQIVKELAHEVRSAMGLDSITQPRRTQ